MHIAAITVGLIRLREQCFALHQPGRRLHASCRDQLPQRPPHRRRLAARLHPVIVHLRRRGIAPSRRPCQVSRSYPKRRALHVVVMAQWPYSAHVAR